MKTPHTHPEHAHSEPTHSHKLSASSCCATTSPCSLDAASENVGNIGRAAVTIPAGSTLTKLTIAQMDCPTEETLIRKKLGGMDSVQNLEFNLMQRVLTVIHTEGALASIEAAIRDLGMDSEPVRANADVDGALIESPAKPAQKSAQKLGWLLAVSGVAALAAEAVHWLGLPEVLSALLALLAIGLCGLSTYKKGWIALRHGNLNINALMSIAVTGAVLLQQWPEAAMVMVLFTLAELIEAKSLDRARKAISGLMQLAPELATVQQENGQWAEVLAKTVAVGAVVRLKPGERVALDGVVIAGQSSINQAPITGESLPVEKSSGDTVFAGTINTSGSIDYRVTAKSSESTLARIIHAVEEAQGARAPTQRFVDQFSKVYTPVVFAIALAVALISPLFLGGLWTDWVYRALVLLVIACPCALVISTPVTIVSGLAAAARHGILIKGGVYLEEGHKLKWLALDKTGTITHGKPKLTDTVFLGSGDEANAAQAIAIATSLVARSDHPVSQAIARAGIENQIELQVVNAFSALPGRGVQGVVDGVNYQLGNHRLIHELGACNPALEEQLGQLEKTGKTVILLTDGERVLLLFAVADTVKATSRAAIVELHKLGIKTLMLSGDNGHTAKAIAAEVGIDEALGDQLPEDKRRAIEHYAKSGKVGMVGDGINDAPALARADIGFAMGAAGSDTAIETADVALMDDDLNKIAQFVLLSRRTRNILIQNISFALGIKAIFLVITFLGLGTMWMAVFADMGASLLVVANGLRLVRK